MRASVEVYENNAGGICVAVFGWNGLENILENLIPGFCHEMISTAEFIDQCLYGCYKSDDFDPAEFSGMDMDSVYDEISSQDDLIAEFFDNKEIILYPANMGINGRSLFGMA